MCVIVVYIFVDYVGEVYCCVVLVYVYVDFYEDCDDVGVLVDWVVVFCVYVVVCEDLCDCVFCCWIFF